MKTRRSRTPQANEPAKKLPARLLNFVTSDRARLFVFLGYLGLVAAMGGASRNDVLSLLVLRPASFLVLAYALTQISMKQVRRLGIPLAVVVGLALTMIIQLIPLPPGLWQALPGRAEFREFGNLAGLGNIWRPITLSPSLTLNSLFSLVVPTATLLLFAIQKREGRLLVFWAILAIALATALFSFLQILGPSRSPLYLYRITNFGSPVGLFSNRNHNAILLAATIPMLGFLAMRTAQIGKRSGLWQAVSVGSATIIVPLILIIGSRAGTILVFGAIIGTGFLYWNYQLEGSRRSRGVGLDWIRKFVPVGALIAIAIVTYASWTLSRSRGLERVFNENLADELRFRVFPYLVQMAGNYFPFGSGFGTFYKAYELIEPDSLLRTQYLNQAHNDLLQVIIEGGLAAVIILLVTMVWLVRSAWLLLRAKGQSAINGRKDELQLAGFSLLSLAVLLTGSLLDYPLRAPLSMAIAALLSSLIGTGTRCLGPGEPRPIQPKTT